jgi:hypothetical protein
MATQPSLRIGDRERDAVAAELQEHYAHGRLTLEEFSQRLDAVFAAKTQSDLSRITTDLPHVRTGGAPLPVQRSGPAPRPASGRYLTSSWAGQDWAGDWTGRDRSRHGRRHIRRSLALFSTLIAALASWLIVVDFMPGLRFIPGRIGILLAIFAVIRGLLRRIFRGGRFTGPR